MYCLMGRQGRPLENWNTVNIGMLEVPVSWGPVQCLRQGYFTSLSQILAHKIDPILHCSRGLSWSLESILTITENIFIVFNNALKYCVVNIMEHLI